jgi:hypothetical protein
MNRLTRLAISLATPALVLAVVWVGGTLARRHAPGAVSVVAVLGVLLWVGSIHVVGRGLHRALWQERQTDAGPWGKLLLTALITVLWFGLMAQLLALALPHQFRRP